MELGHIKYKEFDPIPQKQARKVIPDIQSAFNVKYYRSISGVKNMKRGRSQITRFFLPYGDSIYIHHSKRLKWTIYDGGAWVFFSKKLNCTVLWRVNDRKLVFIRYGEIRRIDECQKLVKDINTLWSMVEKEYSKREI